jgi:hypothetical protein
MNRVSERTVFRLVRIACGLAALFAWLVLVLRYQYGVEWFKMSDAALDGLFLGAIAGIAIARRGESRGGRAAAVVGLRVALVISVTGVALVAAEYGARYYFRQAGSSGNAGDYLSSRRGGPSFRTNALGFRDRDVPPKSDRLYRIVVVGDSFTYGNGLEESQRYTNQLQERLGAGYEVFNFGVPGNNLSDHVNVLARALEVRPDFVLLQLYINDFETPGMRRPRVYPLLPLSLHRTLERSSLLYDLIRDQWVRLQQWAGWSESYAQFLTRHLKDPNGPDARFAYGQLREFFGRARSAGVRAGTVFFPAPDALGPRGRSYPFHYLHVGVQRVCTEEGVRCLDLLPLYSEFDNGRRLWVSPFDAHPNELVSRLAAAQILEEFRDSWQQPARSTGSGALPNQAARTVRPPD